MTAVMIPPPCPVTDRGEARRIGVEIEFAGISCEAAAELVRGLFGGRIEEHDPYRFTVRDTRYGGFEVELDSQFAHADEERPGDGAAAAADEWRTITRSLKQGLASAFADVASAWLPVEIVSPPVPLACLPDIDRLVPALREAGAEGTDAALVYAFATQFNPEVPSSSADSLLRHLKAFLLLAGRLRRSVDPVVTRRLLPFTDPFPPDYATKVVDPAYRPSSAELIDDYIGANPTRNRELDMLPVLAHVDPERVFSRLRDKLIKARPTFHYRLPDTRLSDPSWGLLTEWNRWVQVERLAADEAALEMLGREFLRLCPRDADAWSDVVDPWLDEHDADR
jgi:putative amidoligase enzyme